MSNDYLELRKAASRTTPFARKQARGQAAAVAMPLSAVGMMSRDEERGR